MSLTPRPHQEEAIAALVRAFAVHPRARLTMACGSGKTAVARFTAEAMSAKDCLVLVPSLDLISQTLKEWRRVSCWKFDALIVCSDPTTAAGESERAESDETMADLKRESRQSDARVTTDPTVIERFLRTENPHRRVVFSTYHSSPMVAAAQASTPAHRFTLAVCDEAHRLAGNPGEAFRTVLNSHAIASDKRLFMTATPRVSEDDAMLSMDNPELFGAPAFEVSFGDAIEAGLLTDYKVVVMGEHHDEVEPAKVLPSAVARAMTEHSLSRVISFHSRNSQAAQFVRALDGVMLEDGRVVRALHIHSGVSSKKRAEILEWLGSAPGEQEVRLLASVKVLSEGVDVPAVDGIVFASRRKSVVDIVQALGRVVRPFEGKESGTVVLPVAIDTDADDDDALALSDFTHVWTVLRALKAHDPRFATEIDTLCRHQALHRSMEWTARGVSDRLMFVMAARYRPCSHHAAPRVRGWIPLGTELRASRRVAPGKPW